MQQCVVTIDHRFLLHREPNIGRIALQRFPEESGGSNPDHRKRMTFYRERGPYDGWIAGIDCLPDAMAEHGHRGSRRLVVFRRDPPPAEGAYTEGREIIPGDVLRAQRSRERFDAFTPRT